MTAVGPLGRLGLWTATHVRAVAIAWAVVIVALGFFAPRAEHALSGAGWEAGGSESVEARELANAEFAGLSSSSLLVVVHSAAATVDDPEFAGTLARVQGVLAESDAVASVVAPQDGASISRDRRTAVVQAGSARDTTGMVRAAGELQRPAGASRRAGNPGRRSRARPGCGRTSTPPTRRRC